MTVSDCVKWQRLILNMKANDVYLPPEVWKKHSRRILSELGHPGTLASIEWWIGGGDDPEYACVRTGASHVLKHLVWLIDEISLDHACMSACDTLAVRLTAIDWTPKDRAAKFMIAASYYLARRPPEVAWGPLQQLARWNGDPSGKIPEVVREYAARHALVAPPSLGTQHSADTRQSALPITSAHRVTATTSVMDRIKRLLFGE